MKKTILLTILFCLAFFGKDATAQIKLEDVLQKTQKITGGKTETMRKKNGLLPDSMVTLIYDSLPTDYPRGPFSEIYSYDGAGRLIDIIYHKSGAMSTRSVNIYTGDYITENQEHWWNDTTDTWEIYSKERHYFDEDGVDTLKLNYYFTSPTDSFVALGERKSFLYDAFGRAVFYESTYFPDWQPNFKYYYSYSGSDTVPNEITGKYFDGVDWVTVVTIKNLKWDLGFDKAMGIEPSVRYWEGMSYDSSVVLNGKIQTFFSYKIDAGTQQLALRNTVYFFYDSRGSQIMNLELFHHGASFDTSFLALDTFVYGSSDEILTHGSFAISPLNQPHLSGIHETYYYGKTPVKAVKQREAIVFPNPVLSGESVQIAVKDGLAQVSAYDIKGQLVKTWIPDESGTVSTNGLMPGIYFLKATGGNGLYTGRLVVR